jgi:2'-5' RNA ligase
MSESRSKEDHRDKSAIRTFICLEIPPSTKERIARLQSSLRRIDAQVSWVKPANIHLTLKFLGDVPATQMDSVCEAASRAAHSVSSFEIEVSGAGCFPSQKSPRVLWVGLASIAESLKRLHRAVEDELAREGFPPEAKRFSPHLTLGRMRSPRNSSELAEELIRQGFEAETFRAEELIVMRSDLNPGGSIYTPQSIIRLGGKS